MTLLTLPSLTQSDTKPSETVVTQEMCSGVFMMTLQWSSSIGQQHKLTALFDTGASITLIDPDSIERISGKRLAPGTRAIMDNVSVGGLKFSKFSPRVRELDHIGQALGRRIDVLLQFQTFADYLLTLDYDQQQIRVSQGNLPRPDGKQVFSARGPDSRPWLKTKVGSRHRKLLLDSGSNGTVSVKPHRSIKWSGPTAKIRLSQGLSDLELNEVGRYQGSLQIGPLEFTEPFVGLSNDTELVGYDVLKNFILTFDQRKKRVAMRPISSSPVRMQPRTGSGALLRPRKDFLEIAYLVAASPAAAAGLAIGDEITHINGISVSQRGCRDMQPRSGLDTYTIRRKSTQLRVSLQNTVLLE